MRQWSLVAEPQKGIAVWYVVEMNWMIRNMYGHNLINYLRQSLSFLRWAVSGIPGLNMRSS